LTPTSDQSTASRRRITVDEYVAQRTHKLGALGSDNNERVSFSSDSFGNTVFDDVGLATGRASALYKPLLQQLPKIYFGGPGLT